MNLFLGVFNIVGLFYSMNVLVMVNLEGEMDFFEVFLYMWFIFICGFILIVYVLLICVLCCFCDILFFMYRNWF